MPIDYTTALGQLRLLTSDADETRQILTDDEMGGFLGLYGLTEYSTTAARATLKRVAADVLDAMATSEALVSKVIRSQDLQTDGAKVADALRKHAQTLRAQADADDTDDGAAAFEVAEFTPWPVTSL